MRHFKKLNNTVLEDLREYIDSYNHMLSAEHTECLEAAFEAIDDYYDCTRPIDCQKSCDALPKMYSPMAQASYDTAQLNDITAILKQPSFAENLFRIIDEKNLKDSRVYKKADIDRRLFSKIRSDAEYHPSKGTTIKLCLALELDIAETERLMETAGYCLSMSSTSDLIVRYCIEKGIYNLINVNEALDYFSQSVL